MYTNFGDSTSYPSICRLLTSSSGMRSLLFTKRFKKKKIAQSVQMNTFGFLRGSSEEFRDLTGSLFDRKTLCKGFLNVI